MLKKSDRFAGREAAQIQRKRKGAGLTAITAVMALIYFLPLLVTFTNSFMGPAEISRNYGIIPDIFSSGISDVRMRLIPERVSLSQYKTLLLDSPVYLNMFWNSVRLTFPVVLGQLTVSSAAAYAFTVLRFRGKEILFFIYIIVMLLPQQVTLMPNYMVAETLGLGSYAAIILPGIFHPLGVFLLRQQMKMIPTAYFEAARMDGAGHLQIFCSIVLPLVKSGMAATAILTMIDYWNLIDQAIVFIRDGERQPLSVFLAAVNAQEPGVSFAGACFYAVPVLLTLFFGQKRLKEGIRMSGIRG